MAAIKDASAATEVVKSFLESSGIGTLFFAPLQAERTDGSWIVTATVGFKRMTFEIDASTGGILRYSTK